MLWRLITCLSSVGYPDIFVLAQIIRVTYTGFELPVLRYSITIAHYSALVFTLQFFQQFVLIDICILLLKYFSFKQ